MWCWHTLNTKYSFEISSQSFFKSQQPFCLGYPICQYLVIIWLVLSCVLALVLETEILWDTSCLFCVTLSGQVIYRTLSTRKRVQIGELKIPFFFTSFLFRKFYSIPEERVVAVNKSAAQAAEADPLTPQFYGRSRQCGSLVDLD